MHILREGVRGLVMSIITILLIPTPRVSTPFLGLYHTFITFIVSFLYYTARSADLRMCLVEFAK